MNWTREHFETLKRMRGEGRLASEIASFLGTTTSRVHNKMHHSGLTKDGQRNALKVASERIGDTRRSETVRSQMDSCGYNFGYVLGVLLGDGSVWSDKRGGHVMRLRVRDADFAEKFKACLSSVCPDGVRISSCVRVFDQPESVIRTPDHVFPMKSRSVRFAEVTCSNPGVVSSFGLAKKGFLLSQHDFETKRGVLDGLWDSEGYFVRRVGRAGLKMTNHAIVRWFSNELLSRGVENKVYLGKSGYTSQVSIHKKEAVRRFCSMVGCSIGRKEVIRLRLLSVAS